jgi:hypothetical protein
MRTEHNVRFMRRNCSDVGFEVLNAVVMKHSIISGKKPVQFVGSERTFRRNISPPYSRSENKSSKILA